MTVLLDTSRYRRFCTNDPEVVRTVVCQAECAALPLVVLAELRAGFGLG